MYFSSSLPLVAHTVILPNGQSNVLVNADERACIADFGLSRLLMAIGGPTLATSRQNKGTVRWMAPELLDPDNSHTTGPTTRSDVYSFGSLMLQVCDTGITPSL